MDKHVDHLLTAYVHRQLTRAQRSEVARHIQRCEDCRAALVREQELASDISVYMPQIGQPRRGQLTRLWPTIWREFSLPPVGWSTHISSYGLAVAIMVLFVFAASALFSGTAHADAASFGIGPAAVSATFTPVAMIGSATATDQPSPSETASAFTLPMASPIPIAAHVISNDVRFVPGR